MNRRHIRPKQWRRILSRITHTYFELIDIARHEGAGTVSAIVKWRVSAFSRYLLVRIVSRPAHTVEMTCEVKAEDSHTAAKPGVLFIGYVEAGLGLGGSLRGLIDSISDKQLPFAIYPFNLNVESRYLGPFRPENYDLDNRYQINVIEIATDQLPIAQGYLGREKFASSYNILRTYWELPSAPAAWKPILDTVDELWVANRFVADAFRPIFDRTISIIPPCVEVQRTLENRRKSLGLQDHIFYFLFSFDYFSFPARKNPVAVVRAFQAAFPEDIQNVGLIMKSTGSNRHFGDFRAIINGASRRDPRIVVIDRTLTQDEINALIENSDSYISLHRSEGFGLGMAESMAHEKPVIGTDFSGSEDFLSDATGFPIPYRLRPVRHGEYPNSEGQVWAEPDIHAAAAAMRQVAALPRQVKDRARAGMIFVNSRYSKANVGTMVENRISAILSQISSA